jgi:MurNAc alpha-1-phosphate uridylyltransferase
MMTGVSDPLLPVALLAGGLATRLRPITETIPKALVDVAGRPFIAWQLELLQRQGVTDVIVCAGYLGERIQDVVADGAEYGLAVRYSFDGERLLGTGGALRRALPLLDGPVFVLYGDSYLPISMRPVQQAYRRSGRAALMTVFRNDGQWDRSNVEYDGTGSIRYDKRVQTPTMHYIDYGLGVLSREVIAAMPADTVVDLADTYRALSESGQLAGYEVHERFYEVGSFEGLEDMRRLVAGGDASHVKEQP